jgi:ATP-dependent Clp protease ATP-binding subunit ClpA
MLQGQRRAEIRTGHLLLGLIHEGEGIAASVLERRGVTLEAMRAQVAELLSVVGLISRLRCQTDARRRR